MYRYGGSKRCHRTNIRGSGKHDNAKKPKSITSLLISYGSTREGERERERERERGGRCAVQ